MGPKAPIQAAKLRDAACGRAGRRALRAVSDILARLIVPGEERALAIVEAVEAVGWRRRVVFGSTWAAVHRVALVFTDRRLLEIALSFGGRRATGRVREYLWSAAMPPRADARSFALGEVSRWFLRRPLRVEVVAEVLRLARSSTPQARRGSSVRAWRLCPRCGATEVATGASCQRCGALRHSSRLAALLSLAFPGAGLLYGGRPGFAVARCVAELACLAIVAHQLLAADGAARTALVVGVGAAALVLIKAESVHMTRVLVARAGESTTAVAKRWRRLIPVGMLLSVAALVAPFFVAGATSSAITGDLDAHAQHLGWSVSRAANEWAAGADDPETRAEWRHRDGWIAHARAWSSRPFERPSRALDRWLDEKRQNRARQLAPVPLAGHDTYRVVNTVVDEHGGERAVLEYVLLDEYGRDVHVLTAQVPETELEQVDTRLQELIPCLFWIEARR